MGKEIKEEAPNGDERFAQFNILEVIVTVFIACILVFLFAKILFF